MDLIDVDKEIGFHLQYIPYIIECPYEIELIKCDKDLLRNYKNYKRTYLVIDDEIKNFLIKVQEKCGDFANFFQYRECSLYDNVSDYTDKSIVRIDGIEKYSEIYISSAFPENLFKIYSKDIYKNHAFKVELSLLRSLTKIYNPIIINLFMIHCKILNKYEGNISKSPLNIIYDKTFNPQMDVNITYENLVEASFIFNKRYTKYPTLSNLIENFKSADSQKMIVLQASNVNILVPKEVYLLIEKFMDGTIKYGSDSNKYLYKDMNANDFIIRCIKKRPLAFYGAKNNIRLRSYKERETNIKWFEDMVEYPNKAKFPYYYYVKDEYIHEYISYNEMQFSAFLGVAVPTFFINDGDIHNDGIPTNNHFEKGIYTGLVGARFDEPLKMEHAFLIVKKDMHTEANLYGKNRNDWRMNLWADFYDLEYFRSYNEIDYGYKSQIKNIIERYVPASNNTYLDLHAYSKRMKLVYKMYFNHMVYLFKNKKILMNEQSSDKSLYVIFVGLRTGVWAIDSSLQEYIIVQVIYEIIQEYIIICETLKEKIVLEGVELNWMDRPIVDLKNNRKLQKNIVLKDISFLKNQEDFFKKNNINIIYSIYGPLRKELEGKCVGCCYSWDANSFAGNEYWEGFLNLHTSGNPAAASCSTISQLQNPYINTTLSNPQSIKMD